MVHFDAHRALQLLRLGSGRADAQFRDGQEEAIAQVVQGQGRLLVVQKTGWGKSFVYFIACKLLREAGLGPTVLISPLLALMRNQIAAATRMGVRAVSITSDNVEEWQELEAQIAADEVDIVLIAPERFANARFRERVLAGMAARIALLVVDEAHCISDWGHDFRPDYRRIERLMQALPPNMRLLATTATANERVMADLQTILGSDLHISRGELHRPSLTLQTIRMPDSAMRLAWLAQYLPKIQGSGIIYTLTIRDSHMVAEWLRSQGIDARAYHSRAEDKEALEQALLDNTIKALVSTTALGMGYDKPDLAFVIHFQMPGSVVAYYQQVGRAGRAIDHAYGILLSGEEDAYILDYFIDSAFPSRAQMAQVLETLHDAPQGLSTYDLMRQINMPKNMIDKAIKLLSLESPAPIVQQDRKWRRTAVPLSEAFWQRAERLTALREREMAEMRDYVALPFGQHMAFLLNALDSREQEITPPAQPPLSEAVDAELLVKAQAFLERTGFLIKPRERWPNGGLPRYGVRGMIAPELRAEEGRALCMWGEGRWAEMVKRGKYVDMQFDEALVQACVEMLQQWQPQPAPEWVTCVPSFRRPDLVPDFAQRLAHALDLPFYHVLRAKDRPEQKTMANAIQQARNVDGVFSRRRIEIPHAPVLLVDDMVDSGWTLTAAAWGLRKNGCGKVWPLALAHAGVKR